MEDKTIRINVDIMCFIIFLVLKLDGIIDWKWIWVFSPFWVVWIAQIAIAIVVLISKIELNHTSKYASGEPLVWDAKTNTLYGPYDMEDNAND